MENTNMERLVAFPTDDHLRVTLDALRHHHDIEIYYCEDQSPEGQAREEKLCQETIAILEAMKYD
jgi:hypothetical protein